MRPSAHSWAGCYYFVSNSLHQKSTSILLSLTSSELQWLLIKILEFYRISIGIFMIVKAKKKKRLASLSKVFWRKINKPKPTRVSAALLPTAFGKEMKLIFHMLYCLQITRVKSLSCSTEFHLTWFTELYSSNADIDLRDYPGCT